MNMSPEYLQKFKTIPFTLSNMTFSYKQLKVLQPSQLSWNPKQQPSNPFQYASKPLTIPFTLFHMTCDPKLLKKLKSSLLHLETQNRNLQTLLNTPQNPYQTLMTCNS